MRKFWAILIWGVLIFAIGTYLDKVRGMLMLGGDPVVTYVVRFGLGLVLVVAVVGVRRWLRGTRMDAGGWFVAGALAWGLQGLYVWLLAPRGMLDLMFRDTIFVLGYLHAAIGMAVLFGLIGVVYLLHPLDTRRVLPRVMGQLHFWISFAAMYVVLWMESYKYVDVTNGTWGFGVRQYWHWQAFEVVGWAYTALAILFVGVQMGFGANLVASLFRRRR